MIQTDTAATPRVLLLNDHALLRRGMRDALRDEGLQVVGEAASWNELQPLLRSVAADVLVLDGDLPGPAGLDLLGAVQAQPSAPATLVMAADPQAACAAQPAGATAAAGYLSKSCDIQALSQAIRTVAEGRQYLAAPAGQRQDSVAAAPPQLRQRLSDREQQLLEMLASGRRLPDIAERLELAPKAVSVYRARLLEKMKLSTNAELAHYAATHHLVGAAV